MGGGILSGLIWGSAISVVALTAASLLAPVPERPSGQGSQSAGGEQSARLTPQPGDTPGELPVPAADTAPEQTQTTPPSKSGGGSLTGDAASGTSGTGADGGAGGGSDAGSSTGAGAAGNEVTSTIDLPAGSEFRRAPAETEPSLPGQNTATRPGVAPSAPAAEMSPEAPAVDTASVAQPEAGDQAITAPVAPEVGDSSPAFGQPETTETATTPVSEPQSPANPGAETTPAADTSSATLPVETPQIVQDADVASASGAGETAPAAGSAEQVASVAAETATPTTAATTATPATTAATPANTAANTAQTAVTAMAETAIETAESAQSVAATTGSSDVAQTAGATAPAAAVASAEVAQSAAEAEAEAEAIAREAAEKVGDYRLVGDAAPQADTVATEAGEQVAMLAPSEAAPNPALEVLEVSDGERDVPQAKELPDLGEGSATPRAGRLGQSGQRTLPRILGRDTPSDTPSGEASPDAAVTADAAPEVGVTTAPRIGVRVTPLTERNRSGVAGVKINRFPRAGDQEVAALAPDAAADTPVADAPADGSAGAGDTDGAAAPRLTALARNAAPFENPDDKPLFSVVLIDAGAEGLPRDVLTTFSFPVTFVVDPASPGAEEAARSYRDAGFEVLILTDIPKGARPQDIEVTLASYLSEIPGAVGVIDTLSGGFASDRTQTAQVLDVLNEDGLGMVTWPAGLNAALSAAQKSGQPAAVVYRALDAERENPSVIRRYLDRAAFKAGQDGQVIMVGHSYPETVTALYEWALNGKSSSVALAPVSAVLRAP